MPQFNTHTSSGHFKLLDISNMLVYTIFFLLFIFMGVYNFYDCRGLIFLGSIIPEKYFNRLTSLPMCLFHFYVGTSILSSTACLIGCLNMYAFYLYFLIAQELRLGRLKYVTCFLFRQPINLRFYFRTFQILHQHLMLNSHAGLYLLFVNAISMTTGIYFTFVLIRYWKVLNLITKIPMIIGDFLVLGYWSIFLQIGCMFYVGGSKTFASWKKHIWRLEEQNRVMKKFIPSCQLILFAHGKDFVIGKLSVMNYYRGVERGTFRALLAL